MNLLPAVLLVLALAAPIAASAAPTFESRIAAANAAVGTRAGFIYDTAMVPAVHDALVPCVPKGTDPARGGAFTFVADVDASGRVSNADVRPASPLAACFARRMTATRLRPPPLASRTAPYPIVVEMGLRP